jgi:PLP dependent protein
MTQPGRTVTEWQEAVESNLADIRLRIADASNLRPNPEELAIELVAVSKGMPIEAIEGAYRCGQRVFGENYADELVGKAQQLLGACPEIRWTFQGRLQSNKINRLIPFVSLWQSVDSVSRAEALGSRAPGAAVMIQVDATQGLADRSGVAIADAATVVAAARSAGLRVRGLMTVAPLEMHKVGRPEDTFRAVRALADSLQLEECSMGMSGDLEVAIAMGSTMVRVGSAIFGSRP